MQSSFGGGHFRLAWTTLLLSIALVSIAQTASTPLVIGTSYKYSHSASVTLNIAAFQANGTSTVNSQTFVITLVRARNDSNYKSPFAIEHMQADISSKRYDFSLTWYAQTTTLLGVIYNSSSLLKIQSMRFRYLTIETAYGDFLDQWYTLTHSGLNLTAGSNYTSTSSGIYPVNMSGTIKSFVSITGFNVSVGTTYELSLRLQIVRSASSRTDIVTTLTTSNITFYGISFVEMTININEFASIGGRLTMGTMSASNGGAMSYSNPAIIRDFNTIIGLDTFHYRNLTTFSFTSSTAPSSSLSATSPSFTFLSFNYLILEEYWCGPPMPFLLIATLICYDVCPLRYYPRDYPYLVCQGCLYDCYECNSTVNCISCNATTDFRVMNATTARCQPIAGYYQTGVTTAAPCNVNCSTCTSYTICTSCIAGFSLISSSCIKCPNNCSTCTSTTVCTACISPYQLSGTTCVLNCSLAIGNCTTCVDTAGTITCTVCVTGYSIVNNTCSIVCGDGVRASTQACDDSNIVNGDGCSSTCTIEPAHYCTGSVGNISVCSNCSSNCLNCTSASNCTLCSTFYNLSGTVCVINCSSITNCATCQVVNASLSCTGCVTGYAVNGSVCSTVCGDGLVLGSQGCDDNNTINGDGCSSVCAVEAQFYCLGQPSNCSACLQYCLSCVNGTSCSTCNSLTIWNSSTLTCEANCSYVTNCSTCNISSGQGDYVQCITCLFGYSVDASNICTAICGDGLVAPEQGCDDGNTVDGDGCSSICQIQSAYFCQGDPSTCYPCSQYCLECPSNSSCTACSALTYWNSPTLACEANCSFVENCSTCNISTASGNQTVQCLTCLFGYSVNASNVCTAICGDGLIAPEEGCDDGNTVDGDGCNSLCIIESAHFCQGEPSACYPCVQYCLDCVDNTSCTTCNSLTQWNSSVLACEANCTLIYNCSTCNITVIAGNDTVECLTCLFGYSVNASNVCTAICGDGLIAPEEGCDDSNTFDGDGCSSLCQIEPQHFCQGQPSACYPCVQYCLDCVDNSSCTTCNSLTLWVSANVSCQANCSVVSNCSTCNVSSVSGNDTVQCLTCLFGYSVDASNICTAICGDGLIAPEQTCDDSNTADGDGCSSICQIQAAHFCQGQPSNCYPCVQYCLDCVDNSSCTTCNSLTLWVSVNISCEANCSVVSNCSTCNVSTFSGTDYVQCLTCLYGYSVDASNLCSPICGDGLIAPQQTCDDSNTADGDGCSSLCQIQAAHFCQGQPSACYPCIQFCLDCVDNTSCTTCNSLTLWVSANVSCQPNCSVVSNCSTCNVSSVSGSEYVQCYTCFFGYSVDASNLCSPICGDGLIAPQEGCDDSNTVNGDGCSSSCMIEPKHFCQGEPSACYPCLQYCLDCVDNTSCTTCNSLTLWNPTNVSCQANCSVISGCLTCDISSASGSDYLQCLTCSGGYSVDPASNTCKPICGDGIMAPQQACQDGNLNDGDGCNSVCNVETYFACNTSAVTGLSECYLISLDLTIESIMKNQGENSGTISIRPEPEGLPIYETINWAAVIQMSHPDVQVKDVRYDPEKKRIVIDFDYSASLDSEDSLDVQINPNSETTLSNLQLFTVSSPAISTNNAALVYYQDSEYGLANIAKYLAMMLGACSVLFILAGLLGGRLIGLQCSGLIQLSFVCLLSLEDLSPTLSSLKMLRYSLGYNSLQPYDQTQSIDRPYIAEEISSCYIYNYNIMAIMVAVPAISALVCKIISVRSEANKDKDKWLKRAKLLIGEYTLYLFLCFSYLAYLSLFVQIKYLGSDMLHYMGIGQGAIFLVAGVCLAVLYFRTEEYFTQFKQKFRKERACGNRFYLFPIVQRFISPAALVVLSSKSYGTAPIIALFAALLVILVIVKPYKGARKNYRPVANSIIMILVAAIYLGIGFMNDPEGMLSLYGPFIILALLFVCVVYSAYALVQDIRQKCRQSDPEEDTKKVFEMEMSKFTAKLLNDNNQSMLTHSRRNSIVSDEFGDESPGPMNGLRDRLTELKKNRKDSGPVVNNINTMEMDDIDFEDDDDSPSSLHNPSLRDVIQPNKYQNALEEESGQMHSIDSYSSSGSRNSKSPRLSRNKRRVPVHQILEEVQEPEQPEEPQRVQQPEVQQPEVQQPEQPVQPEQPEQPEQLEQPEQVQEPEEFKQQDANIQSIEKSKEILPEEIEDEAAEEPQVQDSKIQDNSVLIQQKELIKDKFKELKKQGNNIENDAHEPQKPVSLLEMVENIDFEDI